MRGGGCSVEGWVGIFYGGGGMGYIYRAGRGIGGKGAERKAEAKNGPGLRCAALCCAVLCWGGGRNGYEQKGYISWGAEFELVSQNESPILSYPILLSFLRALLPITILIQEI